MFGVKRPLRFLIHKLDLSEEQVMDVAEALNDYRLERAQAEIDRQRAHKLLADALRGDTFDDEKAAEAAERQADAARALQQAHSEALRRLHGALNPSQRQKLAFLIGALDFDV